MSRLARPIARSGAKTFGAATRSAKSLSAGLFYLVALVLWSFVMWAWLYATRIPALAKNKIVYDPYRPNEAFHVQLPAQVRWKAGNYNNLMEQPTLFYAVALTLALLASATVVVVHLLLLLKSCKLI